MRARRASPATCARCCRPPRPSRARAGTRSWPTSTASSCPPPPTGSTPAGTRTSPPTAAARASSASWSRPASACRGCCGRPGPVCTELETHVHGLAGRAARPPRPLPLRRHRRRRHPALGVRRGAVRDRGGARAGRHRRRRRWSPTARPRRTRRWRRICASPASRTCARSPSTTPTRCGRTSSPGRSPPTGPAGLRPFFCCASLGTTSSLAFDPVRAIGEICRDAGLWLHVDAAMAGVAAICPEYRWLNDGVELASSYATNAAQVAVHELRLRPVLGRRPRGADLGAVDPARVPAQRGVGERRGDRLPRLARAAGPPVPLAEAVVRAAPLRRRGPAGRAARGRRAGAGAGRARRGASAARAGRARAALARLPAAPRRRRRDAGADGGRQRRRRRVPHAHRARRPVHHPRLDRHARDRAPPRRPAVGR